MCGIQYPLHIKILFILIIIIITKTVDWEYIENTENIILI